MKTTKRTQLAAAAGVAALVVVGLATPASAHGTSDFPKSRALACKELGVADWPTGQTGYEGCDTAFAVSGEHPFSNWNQIVVGDTRQGAAEPQYRSLIDDGALCAAGNPADAGLDAVGAFPTTALRAGSETTLRFRATAVHNPYTFTHWVTKDGWDDSQPLTWDALEPTPFLVADSVEPATTSGRGGEFELPVALPEGKTGHHVVYTVWQGNIKADGSVQSNEAFFSCSDVDFS
ncbi:lytic polysaccharide monooxygenase [Frigoribacterium faeni]|uniref:lytic polysaccharide monooxygenase n=1 Tax=Frigoribacterium faeni TaxID=145483 RepID=UPI00141BBB58|nr:lytic polysaccharide monooxygenase [Frigoribacterium faeni]NIJ05685.1 chitin-binding protein [Frigoribacterium faeni]